MKYISGIAFTIFYLSTIVLTGQVNFTNNSEQYQLHIKPTPSTMILDGELNEEVWKLSAKAENFWQMQPIDGVQASHQTVAYVTYDEKMLYVAAICYDDMDKHFVR